MKSSCSSSAPRYVDINLGRLKPEYNPKLLEAEKGNCPKKKKKKKAEEFLQRKVDMGPAWDPRIT